MVGQDHGGGKEDRMGKRGSKGYSAEKIVTILRAVEVDQGEGKTIKEAIVEHGVTEQTFYRWRRQYGTMQADDVKRLKDLEKENQRLKKLVAELSLDKDILQEVKGKF